MKKVNILNPLVALARYNAWKSQWAESCSVDELSYIGSECHPEDFLLFGKLLFPDLIVAGGGVFLANRYDVDVFGCWLQKFHGDVQAVERMINHTHIYDTFDGCSEDIDDRVFTQIADMIALSWRLSLSDKFPDKTFNVEVSNSELEYGPVITFYQMDL